MGAGAPSRRIETRHLMRTRVNVAGPTQTAADDAIHVPKYTSKDHAEAEAGIHAVPPVSISVLDKEPILALMGQRDNKGEEEASENEVPVEESADVDTRGGGFGRRLRRLFGIRSPSPSDEDMWSSDTAGPSNRGDRRQQIVSGNPEHRQNAEEHSCPSRQAGIAVPDTLQWPERVESVVTATIGLGIGLDEDVTAKEELPATGGVLATGTAITVQGEQSQFGFHMEEEGRPSVPQPFNMSLMVGPMPEVSQVRW
ncbi:hypothetical protein VSDG_08364 [Cytospora chrysosperma]|uniref:Uncharacterized protein n=1 Tax=Cytospora chrysosperma TaxID=252740 RepID=A0A423VGJ6_CYTCH|nr:hypothetical protein VSDG_08364 [Valsa sordida]